MPCILKLLIESVILLPLFHKKKPKQEVLRKTNVHKKMFQLHTINLDSQLSIVMLEEQQKHKTNQTN